MWSARLNATFCRGVDEMYFALRPTHAPIRSVRASSSSVCLTFDDGPSSANTPEVLDLLARHDARATFFVVGEKVSGQDAMLQRMVAERHEIGNHTYSHTLTSRLSRLELRDELQRGADAIEAACSRRPLLARPPFGKDRRRFTAVANECGARTILWSIDSGDAAELAPQPGGVYSAVVKRARPGSIVLLHDGGDSLRVPTLGGCERVLESLASRGFRFVTVSELLAESQPAVRTLR